MLNDLQIRSFQSNDFIAVGNEVTTTVSNVWISGNGAGKANHRLLVKLRGYASLFTSTFGSR